MIQLGDVIEIESSDSEPTLAAKSQAKGKGKATQYPLELASSVIEITDSESEADEIKASTCRRVGSSRPNSHADPGPSSPKRTFISNLKSYPVRPTGSLDNIFTPALQNGVLASGSGSGAGSSSAAASGSGSGAGPTKQNLNGHNHNNPPLFLSSDEEHRSPVPDPAHIESVEVSTSVIEQEPTALIPETQSQIPTQPTAPDSDPIPIEDMDPTSTAVAQILEIIPNVEPTHLLQLVETHLPTYSVFHGNHHPDTDGEEDAAAEEERDATVEEQVQGVIGHVLHLLFENPDYPKADLRAGGKRKGEGVGNPDDGDLEGKGKGKAKDSFPKKPKIDYASIDRLFPGGPNYFDLALVCPFLHRLLLSDFEHPSITSKHLSHISLKPTSVVNLRSTNLSMRLHISPSWQPRRFSTKTNKRDRMLLNLLELG